MLVTQGRKLRRHGWQVILGLLAAGLLGGLLYLQRHLLVALLRLPRPCGLGTGCVDVGPGLATAVMFGFDAVLVALAIWQLKAGGFFGRESAEPEASWQWRAGLVLIGASALAARFLFPELRQLRWDETHMAWLAIDGLVEGRLPLTGIDSSVHIPNPPGAVYLVAPALAPFLDRPGSPEALLTLSGLLSAGTSLLCAWFVRRWFGSSRAGLAAGLVFALGFWPVFLGRRVWQQNLLPPFTVLYVDAVLSLAVNRRRHALVWACGWLALMVQLHYASVTLAPLLLAAIWLARDRLTKTSLASACLIAMLLLTPFLWWEASFDVAFNDIRKALDLSEQPAVVDSLAAGYLLNLTSAGLADQQVEPYTGFAEERPTGEERRGVDRDTGALPALPLRAAGAGTVLAAIGLLAAIALAARHQRRATRLAAACCVAWVLVPVLLLTRHSLEIAQFYLYQVLAAIAILIGLGAGLPASARAFSFGWLDRAWRFTYLSLLATYLAGSALVLGAILMINQQTRTVHYDVPVGYPSAAGEAAYHAWRTISPTQPILIGAQERDVEKLRLALGPAIPAIEFDDCREVSVPTGLAGRLVYFLRDDTPGARYLSQQDQSTLLARIPRPGGSAYQVFSVPASISAVQFADDERWNWPDCHERYVQR